MITVFSDPHLGRTMNAHTTVASRQRLQEAIFQAADKVVGPVFGAGHKLCLGDLFDKFSNPEAVIMQGARVSERCSVVMAGNHDLLANADKVGSLELLDVMSGADNAHFLITPFGESEIYLRRYDGNSFVFVPHHTTTELFLQSLSDAKGWVEGPGRVGHCYLCLHCNYDSGFAVDETALSLSRQQAKALLDAGFDYLLIGHDHHPREDFDGRVVILGNLHPTGFGDITPKRVLHIEEGGHRFESVWEPEGRYLRIDAGNLLAGLVEVPETAEFIEIEGQVQPEQVLELSRKISALWSSGPFAIRNRTEIAKVVAGETVSHDFSALDQVIRDDLAAEPELLELFDGFWKKTAKEAGDE